MDWQTRLLSAGYAGEFDLGSLLMMPLTFLDIIPGPKPHTVKFKIGPDTIGFGASYEEAIADLMLKHPELWRAKS